MGQPISRFLEECAIRRSLFRLMQHSPFIRLWKVIVSASNTLPEDDIPRKAVMHLLAQIGLCSTVAYRSFVTLRPPTIFVLLNEYLSHLTLLSLPRLCARNGPELNRQLQTMHLKNFLSGDIMSKRSSCLSLIFPVDW
jgi:hypothetical protein